MFLDPPPQRAKPYPCSTTLDADGKPIVDEEGRPMSDQTDRVFSVHGP
jgi:hypothetical protein